MSWNINLYPSWNMNVGHITGDQMNSGQMNGGQTNGGQLNSSQSVGGNMNGDQINSGQMNGGQTNGSQLNSSPSVGGQKNGDQMNNGQMNRGQTNGSQLNSSQSVGGPMNGDEINNGQMNGGQTNGHLQKCSSFYLARMEQSLRSNEDQMNEGQTITDQSSGGQINTTLMLHARALNIEFSDDKEKWRWIREGDSRFPEVAELLPVWYSLIEVTINMDKFLPETNYVAHLIFKTRTNSRGLDTFLMAWATLNKRSDKYCALQWKKVVCLKPRVKRLRNKYITLPLERSDGWMELDLGQFYCDDGTGKVVVSLQLAHNDYKMSGLIVAGIELHPI